MRSDEPLLLIDQFLNRSVEPLSAVTQILQMRWQFPEPNNEQFEFLDVFDCEMDRFPAGSARKLWAADALKLKDEELSIILKNTQEEHDQEFRELRKQLLKAREATQRLDSDDV